jgi:hypothetical protein
MDKPISVGDLVMVVRGPHCCLQPDGHEGSTFRVTGIRVTHPGGSTCRLCGNHRSGFSATGHHAHNFYVSRLKRIPPLEELDAVKKDEEITA